MGASIQSQGMNVPQQPQGQGKGGGGRSMFNVPQQQLMNTPFFAGLQAAEQRMAQDPNANMMGTQPTQPMNQIGDMMGTVDPQLAQPQPMLGFGVMNQPPQAPGQLPTGMQGDAFQAQQQTLLDQFNAMRQPMPPQMGNPMLGGLGGMPVPPAAAFLQSPMFGGRNPAQSFFGRMGRSGKGGGFSQAQNPNRARFMGRGLGGMTGFFR